MAVADGVPLVVKSFIRCNRTIIVKHRGGPIGSHCAHSYRGFLNGVPDSVFVWYCTHLKLALALRSTLLPTLADPLSNRGTGDVKCFAGNNLTTGIFTCFQLLALCLDLYKYSTVFVFPCLTDFLAPRVATFFLA